MSSRSVTPSWVETFHDLQSASTVEELWGVLLSWHGIRGSSVWDEPYLLFMRFHRQDSTDADITAALLCTDHRWRKASHHLIDRVAVSDVLDDEQLDVLADWFSGEDFEILIEHSDDGCPDGASAVRRPIWPPLRRWAARRQVERYPERWRDVVEAAETLASRDAAATVAGVMEAADHVSPDQRTTLAEIGLNHGSGTVRLAALPILASTAGADAAIAVAQQDPSAKVRAWKPPHATLVADPGNTSPSSAAAETPCAPVRQASLFEP